MLKIFLIIICISQNFVSAIPHLGVLLENPTPKVLKSRQINPIYGGWGSPNIIININKVGSDSFIQTETNGVFKDFSNSKRFEIYSDNTIKNQAGTFTRTLFYKDKKSIPDTDLILKYRILYRQDGSQTYRTSMYTLKNNLDVTYYKSWSYLFKSQKDR